MTDLTGIATDTSKPGFTLYRVDAAGRAVLRRNLRRRELWGFLKNCRYGC